MLGNYEKMKMDVMNLGPGIPVAMIGTYYCTLLTYEGTTQELIVTDMYLRLDSETRVPTFVGLVRPVSPSPWPARQVSPVRHQKNGHRHDELLEMRGKRPNKLVVNWQ